METRTGTGLDLLAHLNTSYGNLNKKERALQDLYSLQQKDKENFATFLPKFETVLANASGIEYSDTQRITYLKHALNKELCKKLVRLLSLLLKDYPRFVSYLQTIGSELIGLRILNKSTTHATLAIPARQATIARAEPMDWEPTITIQVNRAATAKTKPATQVTAKTIAFRKNNRLCYCCRHAGHTVKECSFLPPIPLRTNANKAKVKDNIELALAKELKD